MKYVLETHIIQRWTWIRFARSEFLVKTLTLPKYGDMILNSMTLTRGKCNSLVLSKPDFWMVWRYPGILSVDFYSFRTSGNEWHLDESNFRRCYSNFLESVILKVTWSQLCLKFFLNTCEAQWKHYFEMHSTTDDFRDMVQYTC